MPLAGETDAARVDLQPGGRTPAPGELALVQSFLNSRWDLSGDRTDIFTSAEALATWLSTRRLLAGDRLLTDDDLARAIAVREGLRAMAFQNNGHPVDGTAIDAMRRASERASLRIRLEPGGARFLADTDAGLDGAIGVLFGMVSRAMADGSWERLKACPGRHCGWVHYDRSRNGSARWCSPQVCGGREKARAYYRRRTGGRPG